MDAMQAIGVILVPLIITLIGFGYLFFAFRQEAYDEKLGIEEYQRENPGEHPGVFVGFYAVLGAERRRKESNKKRNKEVKMKEEGRINPSLYNVQKGHNKNLCISGEDAKQSRDESWGIVIFEKGVAREMMGLKCQR